MSLSSFFLRSYMVSFIANTNIQLNVKIFLYQTIPFNVSTRFSSY